MISSQILQNTIDELHAITRVDFAVMDVEGNEVATTMQPGFVQQQAAVQFANSPADIQIVQNAHQRIPTCLAVWRSARFRI